VLSRSGWFSAPSLGSDSPSRVNDRLAVTRSLGDFVLKPDVIIADPDVLVLSRRSLHLFIIIASDGVWDCVSPGDAVAIVREQLHPTANDCPIIADNAESVSSTTPPHSADLFHRAAKRLAEEAYLRGSSDNIGSCVIDLTMMI